MSGFRVFARKEWQEIWHTWRIWVLPGILLFFATTGPFLAKFTPQIVKAFAGNQLNGLVISTPTYSDSYTQWTKNLSQIAFFALIIIYGGIISSEVKSGTAVLVLTKPISRRTFLLTKVAVHSLYFGLLVILGTFVTWGLTGLLFSEAPGSALWSAALLWLAFGIFFICVMTLLSVLIGSAAGAAGAGLGTFALISIAAIWKPLGTYSPAAINGMASSLALGKHVFWQWPVLTSLLLALVVLALACRIFQKKEL